MSMGFGFSLPAYPLRGGGGNNPFNQSGPTLDLSFTGNAGNLSGTDTYTLDTNFITPQYQVAAQYAVWVAGSGLTQRNFADIVTFTRASTATYFNSAGVLTTAAINEARFDYNPSTLAAQGLLIEEQRTNSIRNNTMQGAVNSTGIASATVASGGTGYTVGDVLTVSGGTGTAATFTVTGASAGVITSVSVTTAGSYTVFPTSPVSVTGGSGSGATFNIVLNGTLPTNWNVSGLGALTQQVVGTGTVNGVTYIDLRFSGTTSTTQLSLRCEPGGTGAIAAANGQTWAMSMWSAIVAGGLTNINSYGYGTLIYDAVGAFIGAPFSNGTINTTSTLTRTQTAGTIATVGTAFIQPQIYFLFNSGVAIDFTLRIGLPQLELGAFATSVIPTTTTALTRNADVASVNTLSPWYNATEGTLFGEITDAAITVSGTSRRIANINDGTEADRITVGWAGATSVAAAFVTDNSVAQASFTSPSGAYPFPTKVALAYKAADFQAAVNGSAFAAVSSGTVPTVNRMTIGDVVTGSSGPQNLNGHVRRITYYPRRLSNADLQTITT